MSPGAASSEIESPLLRFLSDLLPTFISTSVIKRSHPVTQTPTGTVVVAQPEKSFTDSPWYIAALVAANLVVIGLGVALVTRLVPRA